MGPNPITEEIRDIRHRLAEELGNDIYRIGEDLRKRQAESGRRVVQLPPRTPVVSSGESTPKDREPITS